MPSSISKSHSLELVDIIYFGGCYTCIIVINGVLDKFGAIMSLEASDDALVHGLDMCSEIWLEVLNTNTLKTVWGDVTRKFVLQEKDLAIFRTKFLIPLLNPLLIQG